MSRRSVFETRHFATVSDLSRLAAPRRPRVPVDQAEIAFALERRQAVPGITAGEISRLIFRRFGTDRGASTVRNWLLKATPSTTTT